MAYKPTDEEFEVVSEVVDDLSYFYEDEDDAYQSLKVMKKYRLLSILILVVGIVLIIFTIGAIQMKVYETNKIVTPSFIKRYEYFKTIEEPYQIAIDFAKEGFEPGNFSGEIENLIKETKTVPYDSGKIINYIGDVDSNNLDTETLFGKLNYNLQILNEIDIPKDDKDEFKNLNKIMITAYQSMINIVGIIYNNATNENVDTIIPTDTIEGYIKGVRKQLSGEYFSMTNKY